MPFALLLIKLDNCYQVRGRSGYSVGPLLLGRQSFLQIIPSFKGMVICSGASGRVLCTV